VNLGKNAFFKIALRQEGRILIKWNYIVYSVVSIKLYFKEGSSQWWTAVQEEISSTR
jgi:expansin (peptidoglycan-binding protein)